MAANTQCGLGLAHKFDGTYYHSPSVITIRGAQANIIIRPADLCTSDGDTTSSIYVMLSHGDGAGYAQVGWIHKNFGGVNKRFFWQWSLAGPPGVVHTSYFGTPVEHTSYKFTVSRYTSDGFIHMKLNDDETPCNGEHPPVCGVTDFDPTNPSPQGWNDDMTAKWYGETIHDGDDMPGALGSEATFYTIAEKNDQVPGQWSSNAWPSSHEASSCPSYYHIGDSDHVTTFAIWTAPISHSDICS